MEYEGYQGGSNNGELLDKGQESKYYGEFKIGDLAQERLWNNSVLEMSFIVE